MANIKSNIYLLSLLFMFYGLFVYSTTVKAMEMDHSKMGKKMGKKMDKKDDEKITESSEKAASSEDDNIDPWAVEEFASETLDDELNTEIGIVVHHQHKSGNWMIGYKYMTMSMDSLISGTQEKKDNVRVTTEDVARTQMGNTPPVPVAGFNYLMAPVDMSMNMNMLTAMYGVSETMSLMVMAKYIQNDMNMVMHMGNVNTIMKSTYNQMKTAGISDTIVNAMIRASEFWTISFGVSFPTGSIDKKVVMNGNEIQAPYNMQVGSGTFDFLQSVTYKGGDTGFNWGVQESFTYHSAANNNGYVLGNKFEISTWVRKTFKNNFSISSRLNLFDNAQIIGRDSKIMNPSMSPTFDTVNTGRHELDLSLGFSKRFSSGHRLGFEYSKPLSQLVHGIQMETQSRYTLSWNYMM